MTTTKQSSGVMCTVSAVIVDDVCIIRTMSDYDVTCKHCRLVYNGRGKINCPGCGNPWQINDPKGPAWNPHDD